MLIGDTVNTQTSIGNLVKTADWWLISWLVRNVVSELKFEIAVLQIQIAVRVGNESVISGLYTRFLIVWPRCLRLTFKVKS